MKTAWSKWNMRVCETKARLIDAVKRICQEIITEPFEIKEDGDDLVIWQGPKAWMSLDDGDVFMEHKGEWILVPIKVRDTAEEFENPTELDDE